MHVGESKLKILYFGTLFFLADCFREKQQYKEWESLVTDAKHLHHRNLLTEFTKFMERQEATNLPEVVELKEKLTVEQREIVAKRTKYTNHILDLRSPKASAAQVYEWREAIEKLYKELSMQSCSVIALCVAI